MQIAAFSENNFTLGHASVMVNEGLPLYMVGRLQQRFDLTTMTVGILGMAFKGNSDDRRESLSYKLKRLLKMKAKQVLCTDPYVSDDPDLLPLHEVLERADLLIIATPHDDYRNLEPTVSTIDIGNLLGQGVRI
jgi:UDP-N-acetyl-D-mannosaminuronic acid dehydrogenase